MRFGKSAEEAAEDNEGGGGDYMRYLKNGDTTFRILQEPNDWTYYWEHYNPGGFSFPCTNDRETCPGCTSEIEKMKNASRKIAFNILHSYNGVEYVDVIKVAKTVADKLKNRYARLNTLLDRDYTVTKFKVGERTEFDLEGEVPTPLPQPLKNYELKDVETMLVSAYEQAWGTPQVPEPNEVEARRKAKAEAQAQYELPLQPEDPPSKPEAQSEVAKGDDEIVVTEAELRTRPAKELRALCVTEYDELPPSHDPNEIVDWMMAHS